ncbi:hypothetical protein Tco_0407685 [Tanacetum coccineum]
MTKLTQKSMKFDWGEKSEAAFQSLKKKLCNAPILALPKGNIITMANVVAVCPKSNRNECIRLLGSSISYDYELNSRRGPEFTWEREDQMQKKYPHLFLISAPVADATS